MTQDLPSIAVHPTGEQSAVALGVAAAPPQPLVVDSFAGSVRVEWDHATAFTPLGQLPFFIDFLKTAGLFDSFVADSPLNYESPNASKTRDVLGTAMLSMLAGQALFSYRGVARRRGSARASRHEENRQRGLGAARLRGDRGGGGCGVDAATSRLLPGAAFERALDSRHRYDGEAALRPSGRSGGGLQSEEARSTEPLLSHLLDGGHAIGLRRGCVRGG